MTDFQNWWDGYFHEINGQKETAQAAWQARGELDAVRIKDLTALVVQQDKDNNNYAKEIIELTAKLDKARDGDCCTEGCIKCDARKVLAETQEPVAWMHYKDFTLILHDVWEELIEGKDEWYPMYQYKGENMSTHKQQVVTLILTNPENGEEMFFASLITNNNDGSYSFEVANKDNSTRYKHTIKTEEIL